MKTLSLPSGPGPADLRSFRMDPDPPNNSGGGGTPEPKKEPTPTSTPTPTGGGMLSESEVTRLRTLERDTQLLMRTDTDPTRREAAARNVLKESGYTPEQIERWIDERRTPSSPRSQDSQDEVDPNEELRAGLSQVHQEATEVRVQQIKTMMDGAQVRHMGADSEVGQLLKDLGTLHGTQAGERIPKVTKYLKDRIMKETIEELSIQKGRGRLDFGWISPTMEKVAKRVTEEYRAALPDLSMIGRSGETDLGEEEFLKSTPVPAPTYQKGQSFGEGHQKVLGFMTDSLSRLAASGGDGTRA